LYLYGSLVEIIQISLEIPSIDYDNVSHVVLEAKVLWPWP